MQLAPFVVCPETLGPLEPREGGYWSPGADRLYPVRDGLVFMGYPKRDAAMIAATMEEERDWQGTDAAATNLAYLRSNVPRAVDFINLVRPYVDSSERTPRALELGCGNGWVSWLLAEAGFEPWMCDFESNSLATGFNLEHPNIGVGRRFVADARYAPFEAGSMDLVVFKEFVHHVSDYRSLFSEANRVLRDGGLVAFMEPVRSIRKTVYEVRHPDPHRGHHITWPDSYLGGLAAAGFKLEFQAPIYMPQTNRRRVTGWLKDRAVAAIDEENPAGNWFTWLHLRVLGGAQLVVVARKKRKMPPRERPPMVLIDPDELKMDDVDLAGYAEFPAVLEEAAKRLDSSVATP